MDVDFTKDFNKQFAKLPLKRQERVYQAVDLFMDKPQSPGLRNHALKGKWQGYRSISAGGDLRLHYKVVGTNRVLFVAVGSHSQLYK